MIGLVRPWQRPGRRAWRRPLLAPSVWLAGATALTLVLAGLVEIAFGPGDAARRTAERAQPVVSAARPDTERDPSDDEPDDASGARWPGAR